MLFKPCASVSELSFLLCTKMNAERRIIRVGLAAMLSILVVVAVVLTMQDNVSESMSTLFQPTFTDLRIKLPPLPPLTEEQFKSLPPVSTMEYVPPTKAELKSSLARHGVRVHIFKNVSSTLKIRTVTCCSWEESTWWCHTTSVAMSMRAKTFYRLRFAHFFSFD